MDFFFFPILMDQCNMYTLMAHNRNMSNLQVDYIHSIKYKDSWN